MKKIILALMVLVNSTAFAQQQYQMGKETVFVPGSIVSTIKLVDYANKQIGNKITHTLFDDKKAVFTSLAIENNKPRLLILQIISKDAVKGLKPDVEVNKAFIDSDEKTNPKNYWNVSVGFRKMNDDVVEVGSTEYHKREGEKVTKTVYTGTSYVVPFATKAAADEFAAKIKSFCK